MKKRHGTLALKFVFHLRKMKQPAWRATAAMRRTWRERSSARFSRDGVEKPALSLSKGRGAVQDLEFSPKLHPSTTRRKDAASLRMLSLFLSINDHLRRRNER